MSQTVSRVSWIDTCKAYGMILVFYGHLWLQSPNDEVLLQNKLIYAFHMPLFFVISGLLDKENNTTAFKAFIKNKFFTRIVPFIIFNLLLLVGLITKDLFNNLFDGKTYLLMLAGLIRGQGSINAVTWFLTCLLTTEIIHFFVAPKINTCQKKIIAFIIFYTVGIIVTVKINSLSNITGIAPNFWYIHEALLAYPFFLLGVVLKQIRFFEFTNRLAVKYVCLIVSAIVLLRTFNLNNGFNGQKFYMVLMVDSLHGHPIWFLVTALAGTFFLIFLSQITPTNSFLLFLGRNTLVLLGLNGFFRDIFNPIIVQAIPHEALNSHFRILIVCSFITIFSLLLCVPGILFFNKFLPQFIGKPKKRGQFRPQLP